VTPPPSLKKPGYTPVNDFLQENIYLVADSHRFLLKLAVKFASQATIETQWTGTGLKKFH